MNRRAYGFTLVELIIVITVIAILASISIIGFTKYTADTRNAQRSSKVRVLAESLEKYYDKNGEYPSCNALTQSPATISSTTLPGINPDVFTTPSAAKGTNSIYTTGPSLCAALSANSSLDSFAYIGDGSTTCMTGSSCRQYTLQYQDELTGDIISLSSRRSSSLSVLAAPTNVSATSTSPSQTTVAWATVSGAISYTVEYSTSSSFSPLNSQSGISSNSVAISGLSEGQLYYFRVFGVADSNGPASSPVTATTSLTTPTPPTVVASTSGDTTTYSWTTPSCASGTITQFQYQYATDYNPVSTSDWYGPSGVTSASRTTSNEGFQYTTSVQAQCHRVIGGASSAWSSVAQASYISPINGPGTITFGISRPSASQARVSATSSCTTSKSLLTRSDMDIITGTTVWDTGVRGWYADSHNGIWAHDNLISRTTTESITSGNASGTPYTTNSQWAMAVVMQCQNQDTGRVSAPTGRVESGTMYLPAS